MPRVPALLLILETCTRTERHHQNVKKKKAKVSEVEEKVKGEKKKKNCFKDEDGSRYRTHCAVRAHLITLTVPSE